MGANVDILLGLTFREAALGTQRVFQASVFLQCSDCKGAGTSRRALDCNSCRGTGEVVLWEAHRLGADPAGFTDCLQYTLFSVSPEHSGGRTF